MTSTQVILVILLIQYIGAGYSEKVQCLGLLGIGNNKTDANISLHACSSSNLVLYHETFFCFPTELQTASEAFIQWTSLITKRIKSKLSKQLRESLYFGMWSHTTPSGSLTDTAQLIPNLSIVLAGALKQFLQYGSWRRVAVITDQSSILHLKLAETVNMVLKKNVDLYYITLYNAKQANIDNSLNQLVKLKYRIIIVLLSTNSLQDLMCRRLAFKMTWPEYAWIIVRVNSQPETQCLSESIIFQHMIQQTNTEKIIVSDELFDITHEMHRTCEISYIENSLIINIYYYDRRLIYITNYTASGGLSSTKFTLLPSDQAETKLSFSAWFIVFTITNIGVFIALTVIVILYVLLRKTPEIKATSVPLNIYIFLGCYLLLAYSIVRSTMINTNLNTDRVFGTIQCFIIVWCNGISIPTALILSVLLVKLIRIYFIFSHHKVVQKWKCHNITLALYVFLLTLPLVISSTIQAVSNHCEGYAEFYFLFLQLFYLSLISVIMVAVAIKTRKIEAKNFKDTKKIIALMVAFFLTASLGLVYLLIFYIIGASELLNSSVHILTHTSFILECIFLLYVPKYYTAFIRKHV